MKVRVRLFAVARELAGAEVIEVEAPAGATVGKLKDLIAEAHPALASALPRILMAVDSEYAASDTVVHPGAEVACIPPVSGG
jgi:molybdopterin converting factor subunit 1